MNQVGKLGVVHLKSLVYPCEQLKLTLILRNENRKHFHKVKNYQK
jgi:hypothetical protein